MWLYLKKHLQRAPMMALGVLLFAVVITGVLGRLHGSNVEQQENYETVFQTIPVYVRATNLMGTRTDHLDMPTWVGDLFTRWGMAPLLKDPMLKSSLIISDGCQEIPSAQKLVGISSTELIPSLLPEMGGEVHWFEGYSDADLSGNALICLVPGNEVPGSGTITVKFRRTVMSEIVDEPPTVHTAQITLTVAGTYTGGESNTIYCPYAHIYNLFYNLDMKYRLDSARATLADNSQLQRLYDTRPDFFAAPNATGEKTLMKTPLFGLEYFPYALDIDDRLLRQTAETLENSILVNKICTVLIFVLSAFGGVFVGWLTLRQRRRDINLLRTLGTSNWSIYTGFVLEQITFLILGIGIGGFSFGWEPRGRIGIFGMLYFISLSAGLLIFLNTNLLFTMKEDE